MAVFVPEATGNLLSATHYRLQSHIYIEEFWASATNCLQPLTPLLLAQLSLHIVI